MSVKMCADSQVRNRFGGSTCNGVEGAPETKQNGTNGTEKQNGTDIQNGTTLQKGTKKHNGTDIQNGTHIQNGKDRSSESGTNSDDGDAQKNRTLRRTLSDRVKYEERRTVKKRNLPEPEHHSALAGVLAGTRHMVEEAEEFVKSVFSAGWRVVHHHKLPDWLKDNEHLLFGHRVQLNSFSACFKSVFKIHTETGNIWTHLLGMVIFICIATYTLCSRYWDWMWQDITVHSVFFAGAIICLTFSWLFHTVFCHSQAVNKLFSKLDYCGIAVLVVASFVPWLYYGFYCHKVAHITYLVSISLLGSAAVIVSLFDKFAAPEYRPVRAGLFIALGLTGVIPGFHFVIIEGYDVAVYEYGFPYLIIMAILYIAGALMYAFRIPESLYPGKFDIWFHSHQIFHVCVILAALCHFYGINIISHVRLNMTECPTH